MKSTQEVCSLLAGLDVVWIGARLADGRCLGHGARNGDLVVQPQAHGLTGQICQLHAYNAFFVHTLLINLIKSRPCHAKHDEKCPDNGKKGKTSGQYGQIYFLRKGQFFLAIIALCGPPNTKGSSIVHRSHQSVCACTFQNNFSTTYCWSCEARHSYWWRRCCTFLVPLGGLVVRR